MKIKINYSTINSMLGLFRNLKEGKINKVELERILEHDDYRVEFDRYKDRINKEEYINYFLNFNNLEESQIENPDLRNHHSYYKHLINNLDYYENKLSELSKLTNELFIKQADIALKGLPNNFEFQELNFIFTIGIGQSFGYVHENNSHFDYIQLIKDLSVDQFCSSIAHEIHHIGFLKVSNLFKIINDTLDNSKSLEALFYLYLSIEGLAVKYCNNAEGVLSKSIYDYTKNVGLDTFTWNYLNNDFHKTMKRFLSTVEAIRTNKLKTKNDLMSEMKLYWMNPYIEGQEINEIPKLKHSRLYSFGNEIWGIIHDCFGKEKIYEVIEKPELFSKVYNEALDIIDFPQYKI